LLDAANLAGPLAGRAARRGCAWLRAATLTGRTDLPARDLNIFLGAAHRLLEGQGEVVAQIGPTRRATPRAGRGARRAGEERLQDVVEAAEAESSLKGIGPRPRAGDT